VTPIPKMPSHSCRLKKTAHVPHLRDLKSACVPDKAKSCQGPIIRVGVTNVKWQTSVQQTSSAERPASETPLLER
jgi:hypothetical protein